MILNSNKIPPKWWYFCIQARQCNQNTCPVGIATQNRELVNGLNPAEKKVRVYNYHKAVIHEVMELLGAMGLTSTTQLNKKHIIRRDENDKLVNYSYGSKSSI